jgi:hypothetical protein
MKTLRLAVLTTLVAALLAAPAAAGNLGLYFDRGATVDQMHFETGVPFNVHVAMTNMNDSANAVEFVVEMPPEVLVLDHDWLEGSIAFPNQDAPSGTPEALAGVRVGLGGCWYIADNYSTDHLVVLTMSCMSLSDLTGATMTLSGYNGLNGDTVPRYAQCPSTDKIQMTSTGATFNVSVPAETTSWGAVKAAY